MRVRCESEVSRHTEISNVVSWPPKITAFLSTSVHGRNTKAGDLDSHELCGLECLPVPAFWHVPDLSFLFLSSLLLPALFSFSPFYVFPFLQEENDKKWKFSSRLPNCFLFSTHCLADNVTWSGWHHEYEKLIKHVKQSKTICMLNWHVWLLNLISICSRSKRTWNLKSE